MSPFMLISIVWIISEIILSRRLAAADTDRRQDRFSLPILWITIGTAISIAIFLAMQGIGTIRTAQTEIHFAGLFLILSGMALRWIAVRQLKHFFTVNVAIREDHRIIREGLYGYIRHPSYTGNLLSFLGLGLALVNWLSLAIIFIPTLAAFLYRMSVEEQALLRQFGEEYRNYQRQTKRLIPRVY